MSAAEFIRANTVLATTPLVPEIRLYLATEITPIWEATEATLARAGVPPPYWAFPWVGGQALALTRTAFSLLTALAQPPDTALSYGALYEAVYGRAQPEDEARALLRPHIARLRHKIESTSIGGVALVKCQGKLSHRLAHQRSPIGRGRESGNGNPGRAGAASGSDSSNRTAQLIPHSVLESPAQRPSRGEPPGPTGLVQWVHPIDG